MDKLFKLTLKTNKKINKYLQVNPFTRICSRTKILRNQFLKSAHSKNQIFQGRNILLKFKLIK